MLNFLLKALPFIGDKLLPRVLNNKDQVEDNRHKETVAFEERVSAEAMASAGRTTWWDSFVDGLNRLVRPLFTFGTAGLFAWAIMDPIKFTASMTALALVPEPLWIIMGTIVAFWFGQRMVEGMKAPKIDPAQVSAVVNQINEINKLSLPETKPEPVSEERYQKEMADESKPLSNEVILMWNEKRKAGKV